MSTLTRKKTTSGLSGMPINLKGYKMKESIAKFKFYGDEYLMSGFECGHCKHENNFTPCDSDYLEATGKKSFVGFGIGYFFKNLNLGGLRHTRGAANPGARFRYPGE